jgi:hypothetical protein
MTFLTPARQSPSGLVARTAKPPIMPEAYLLPEQHAIVSTLETRPMKSDELPHGKGRAWVPPMVTKHAIGTATKSPVRVDPGIDFALRRSGTIEQAEPQPPTMPASKFGFALEWSFPLSARTE